MLGGNSAGKSSILQALLMLRQSWESGPAAVIELRPAGRLVTLGRFGNIAHRHRNVPVEIGISWDEGEKSADFTWEADYLLNATGDIDENRLPEAGTLTACTLRGRNGTILLGGAQVTNDRARQIEIPFLEIAPPNSEAEQASPLVAGWRAFADKERRSAIPVIRLDPSENTRRIERGSVPTVEQIIEAEKRAGRLSTVQAAETLGTELKQARESWTQSHAALLSEDSPFVAALTREIDDLFFGSAKKFANLRYIGPTRVPGQRIYARDSSTDDEVGSRGERLGDILFRFPDREEAINNMLQSMRVPYQVINRPLLTLDALVELFLLDTRPHGATVGVPDVGFGVSQLLPILAEWAAVLGGTKPQTLLVEQPELHLHPDWQVELLRLFSEPLRRSAPQAGSANPQAILETHSEYLVLAAQQLVREGVLDPENVTLLAVNVENGVTCVQRIRMAGDGEFMDPWPDGFFPQRDNLLYGEWLERMRW